MAVWRVLFMSITLILLSSALYPIGYVPQSYLVGYIHSSQDLKHLLSSPALCLMNKHGRAELMDNLSSTTNVAYPVKKKDPSFNKALISVSLTYLMISFVTRVIRLSRSAAESTNSWLRVKPMNAMCLAYSAARMLSFRSRILSSIFRGFLLICIIMAETVHEIGNSMLWKISWLAAALIWGTRRLVQHRQQSYLIGENTWGFGQVLALMLSALPLWSFLSNLQESVHIPLSTDTNSTNMQIIHEFGRLDQYSWFNVLVSFMFVTALTLAGVTVFAYSGPGIVGQAAIGPDVLYQYTPFVVEAYFIAISWSVLTAILFTAVALAFHYEIIPSSKLSAWWRHRTIDLSIRAQKRILSGAWIALMIILIGGQLVFYFIFPGIFIQPHHR